MYVFTFGRFFNFQTHFTNGNRNTERKVIKKNMNRKLHMACIFKVRNV